MVGRHHEHSRPIRTSRPQFGQPKGRQRQRGGGAAHGGFHDNVAELDPELTRLADHQKPMVLVAYDRRGRGALHAVDTQQRLLKQAALADQRHELFGVFAARQGPQAGARAPGQHDRQYGLL